MLTRYVLIIIILSLGTAFGQTLNNSTVDFSLFGMTRPMTMGSTLPDTCQDGQLFFNTSAPAGSNVFSCLGNQWTVLGNGVPASVIPPATSTTLGAVMIPDNSGLRVNNGTLAVVYGTGPNTAMQGDDSRVTGLANVARTGSYPDLLNRPTIPANTSQLTNDAGFLGPNSNALSATKLAAIPAGCPVGRYATSVTVTGAANCAQVQYSQIVGTPVPFSLPVASSTQMGGVKVGSGLLASLGVVSANVGTAAGTLAAGNDSRIVGALQGNRNLTDLTNYLIALQALRLTGFPNTALNVNITGNAATASALKACTGCTFQMIGLPGDPPTADQLAGGKIGFNLDPKDLNLHITDQLGKNKAVMFQTWKNGIEQKCDQSQGFSAMTDISAAGAPVCTVYKPPPSIRSLITEFGGSGAQLGIGQTNYYVLPGGCSITAWDGTATPPGSSATVDIWKANGVYPTSANSITGSATPLISGNTPTRGVPTGWTTAAIGTRDTLAFNLQAVSGATQVTLTLTLSCQ